MRNKKASIKIWLIVIAVVLVVILIFYLKNNENNLDKKTAKCIAGKSELYISRTCSYCAKQKQILGDYLDYFKVVDCNDNMEECARNNIPGFPTWIINNQRYPGLKNIEQLKEITGC